MARGYVQLYTGNGKGKTTAALGLTLRALGAGMRVFFAQFAKGQQTSEQIALTAFGDQIAFRQYGRPEFVSGAPSAEDLELAAQGLAETGAAIAGGQFGVVVLDEAATAVSLNLLKINDLIAAINSRPERVEVVITGRDAPSELVEIADLVTEMREIKHYYRNGVPARVGIEL